MGKCVRIRGSTKQPPPPPPAAGASCLTLRSGRRVLPVAASSSASACSPRTSGRPRRLRWWYGCGAEATKKKSACGRPRRSRCEADVVAVSPQQLFDDGRPETEEEMPRGANGCGDSFERPKTPVTPLMTTTDCDAAAVKAKAKHENESHRCRGVVAGQTPPSPPPTEAEIEAFFAAAELAERRRFAEAYNYDVALDRPLEGRFEWAPVST